MLAKAEPHGDPMTTRSTCLQCLSSNVKNNFLEAMLNK